MHSIVIFYSETNAGLKLAEVGKPAFYYICQDS